MLMPKNMLMAERKYHGQSLNKHKHRNQLKVFYIKKIFEAENGEQMHLKKF